MPLPITIPNTFANATATIPLSQLDSNFSTVEVAVNSIGNGAFTLANAQITGGTISNVTLDNVSVDVETLSNVTITNLTVDGNATFTNAAVTANVATITTANVTTANVASFISSNVSITGGSLDNVTIGSATAAAANVTNLTVNGNTTLGDANTDTILMTAAPSIGGAGLGMGFGFRNRIINGDMRIDQRNNGAAVTTGGYFVDRFSLANSTDGAFSLQQDSSAPAGFVNSIKFTTTTADAILTTTQAINTFQRIEGTNVADLGWGTANAKTVTLSFWVRSSLTGTFGGSVRNSASDRSYPFTYTISVADTWEYKTVTVAGDTTGTWLTTTGTGILVTFSLGAGPDRSGTAGAWAGASYSSVTGAVSVIGTLNATWYITGVQLEKGSTATSFDYRPYGTELALCQRYCRTLDSASGTDKAMFSGVAYLNNTIVASYTFPTMRTSPTATITNPTFLDVVTSTVTSPNNTLSFAEFTSNSCQPAVTNSGTPFTAGHGAVIRFDGVIVVFSAEL